MEGTINASSAICSPNRIRGIRMGARSVFEAMNRVIEQHAIRPVIDSTTLFEDLPYAYRRIDSGAHFGKVVVTLD